MDFSELFNSDYLISSHSASTICRWTTGRIHFAEPLSAYPDIITIACCSRIPNWDGIAGVASFGANIFMGYEVKASAIVLLTILSYNRVVWCVYVGS